MTSNKKRSILKGLTNPTLVSMFFFGIACGFPLALTASTLKTWLIEFDISMKEIGAFAFVAIPYSIKFLWSPFIDALKLPIIGKMLGQRRSWLVLIQSLLILAIFALASTNPEQNILLCAFAATMVAFFSASQDIVVDAYRIEKLPADLQAMGITIYIYGYRIGLFFSSAILLVIADHISWKYAYYTGGIIMLTTILITLLSSEPVVKVKNIIIKGESYIDHLRAIVVKPFANFTKTEKWHYLILFIILFKLGDALAGNLTNPFLRQIGFSKTEIALIVKTYGLPATLFGAFLGGIIVQKYGLIKSLFFAGTIQMLSNVMFIVQDYYGHNNMVLISTILIENISGSIGDVVFIGYISSLCNFNFAATQYALLSSIATTGRNLISGSSGFIVDNYGWTIFFVTSIIAALPGLLLILKIRNIKRNQKN